jgi:hypothetical protein
VRILPFLTKPANAFLHVKSDSQLTLFELDNAITFLTESWGADLNLTCGASFNCANIDEFRLGMIVNSEINS